MITNFKLGNLLNNIYTMAFSRVIRTLEAKKSSMIIDNIGLPIRNNDDRFRYFWDGAYWDYYGIFSWQEVWDLNEKEIKDDSWLLTISGEPFTANNLELKKFLEKEWNQDHMFLINSYEWESWLY